MNIFNVCVLFVLYAACTFVNADAHTCPFVSMKWYYNQVTEVNEFIGLTMNHTTGLVLNDTSKFIPKDVILHNPAISPNTSFSDRTHFIYSMVSIDSKHLASFSFHLDVTDRKCSTVLDDAVKFCELKFEGNPLSDDWVVTDLVGVHAGLWAVGHTKKEGVPIWQQQSALLNINTMDCTVSINRMLTFLPISATFKPSFSSNLDFFDVYVAGFQILSGSAYQPVVYKVREDKFVKAPKSPFFDQNPKFSSGPTLITDYDRTNGYNRTYAVYTNGVKRTSLWEIPYGQGEWKAVANPYTNKNGLFVTGGSVPQFENGEMRLYTQWGRDMYGYCSLKDNCGSFTRIGGDSEPYHPIWHLENPNRFM